MQNTPRNTEDEADDAESEYYYDDAHGYEEFKEDEDEAEDDDEGAPLGGGALDINLD